MLNHTPNSEANNADATINLSRDTLNRIVLKEETLQQAKDKGDVKITGDAGKLDEVLGYMDKFNFWFNIVTP
ncbi:hypothetical protein D3C75_1365190 [compost metagenome]